MGHIFIWRFGQKSWFFAKKKSTIFQKVGVGKIIAYNFSLIEEGFDFMDMLCNKSMTLYPRARGAIAKPLQLERVITVWQLLLYTRHPATCCFKKFTI